MSRLENVFLFCFARLGNKTQIVLLNLMLRTTIATTTTKQENE